MKKAAIFDLDGTLSDSIMSMKYSGDKTMAEFGYGPFSVQDYKYFVGDGAANLVKRALIKSGDTGLTHFEAAYARYKEIFQANCMYQVKPYEGITELLEELKKRGIPCEAQYQIPVYYKGELDGRYVADIVVDHCVILELKAVSALREEHELQLVNYLKATDFEVGLLLNFGRSAEVKRKIFTTDRKMEIRQSYQSNMSEEDEDI